MFIFSFLCWMISLDWPMSVSLATECPVIPTVLSIKHMLNNTWWIYAWAHLILSSFISGSSWLRENFSAHLDQYLRKPFFFLAKVARWNPGHLLKFILVNDFPPVFLKYVPCKCRIYLFFKETVVYQKFKFS